MGAAGVFQLMPRLARHYGLQVNGRIDERYDVLKNAKVAAEYLSDLYKQVAREMRVDSEDVQNWNSDVWKLVLALYNGGYAGLFLKWAGQNKQSVNYNTYLQFRERGLQNYLDARLKGGKKEYIVKPGESLFKIAQNYSGVTVSQIMKENNLSNDKIKPGQKLIIRAGADYRN